MSNNKFDRLENPPGPMFIGQKERDFTKQVNDELIERVIAQQVVYYPISTEHTNFHPLYGEAIEKTFLPPVHVFALVEWTDNPSTTTNYGTDNTTDILIHFHKRRISEDQNLFVRIGDFIAYDDSFFEITQTFEPKLLFGQAENKFEISAKCIYARQDLFNGE